MFRPAEQHHPRVTFPLLRRVEFRFSAWVAICVFVAMAVFETVAVVQDARTLSRLGADEVTIAHAQRDSIRLHAIHGGVTIAVLVVGIHFVARRHISRRVAAMIEGVHRVRRGSWTLPSAQSPADELGSLAEELRRLGPHLERKLQVFVACDRKATVARLGFAYDASLAPSARRIVALARDGRSKDP